MKKAIIGLIVTALIPATVLGQDYAFKVLVNKGNNEVKSGSDWTAVKVGASLKPDDQLRIADNAYLGLVHVTGKPVEVKKAGTYKVVDLASKVNGGSSVLNKYTDFILSENTQKNNRLVATGAVVRGGDDINIYLPEGQGAVVYGNKVYVGWTTDKTDGPYLVTVNSMFGDELAKIETADSVIQVDLYDKKFQNEDNILFVVQVKGDPSTKTDPAGMVKKISKADRERIKSSLNDFSKTISEETALNKLLLAGFFEQNGLLVDAIAAYQEAMRLEPDVISFKEQYNDFLIRNAIKVIKD